MNETEAEIRRLERELIAAILRRDADFLNEILADDLTFINPFGETATKTMLLNFDDNLVNESIVTDEITVKIYENTAVVTGCVTLKARYRDKDLSGKYRYTRVYLKQNECRQIAAYQATRIIERE